MEAIDCAVKGDVNYFKRVTKDVILSSIDPGGRTVLDRAVMESKLECCEEICNKCPELLYHQNKIDGSTSLHLAAARGQPEIIKLLLDAAAMAGLEQATQGGGGGGKKMPTKLLRTKDNTLSCPLHRAVCYKRVKGAKLLLEADADSGSEYGPNLDIETPLLICMKYRDPVNVEIRKLIHKIQPTQSMVRSGEKNWTALHKAVSDRYLEAVEDIIRTCPDCIEQVDADNKNFLHIAAQSGNTEVVKYVLENTNIDPNVLNAQDCFGNTPLHLAALSGNQTMTSLFLYDLRVSKKTVNTSRQKVLDAVTFDYDKKKAQVSRVRDRMDEKQLKDQSDFDLVVGALIAAISFTAGITVPGGYISEGKNEGMAILSKETAFQTFVVSNTLGLVLSLYAVFSHFCTRRLLRKKDIDLQITIATCCTLSAILAMMVSFVSGSYAVLNISRRLALTVIVICSTFFFFTFGASLRMLTQYENPFSRNPFHKWWPFSGLPSLPTQGNLPTTSQP